MFSIPSAYTIQFFIFPIENFNFHLVYHGTHIGEVRYLLFFKTFSKCTVRIIVLNLYFVYQF